MSMVDDTNRPVRSDERTASGMSGRSQNNDPLAELARLIGQDDPFRDARPAAPRREAPAQPYVEAPRSAPGWLARTSAAPAHDEPPARYADAHDAHYEADARYQETPQHDPQYDAAAYHDGAQGYHAADEAAYDPAHGDDADHYYEDGHYENYETEEAPRRRSGLAIVVAVVGLAVLGTGGVFAYRAFTGGSATSGQVPVVKAPDTPNKVVPPPQNADNTPVKQIYDRVTDKGGNEKIGTGAEEPVDVKNQRTGIPGLIQGVPPGGVATQPPAPPSSQQANVPAPEPKKVKTVPIRPDQPTGTTAPPRAPTAAPAPAPAPMRLSTNQTQAPPVRNNVVTGGFVVQVASQRSEADAQSSYRALQTKYPTVLADREAFIRKADLGDKGVFYRAQLGPFTTIHQANELCASLKTAGGQCVVQKN